MDEREVYPRVAVATALKAQEQGLARLTRTREEQHARAVQLIGEARQATRLLMREGVIPSLRE